MSSAPPPPPPRPPAAALAPGFRFHPTDEELVGYYLKRKVSRRPFRVDAICEIDLYRSEPWDLPAKSRIQSRDTEWYFFSALDKKYANRSRTNRATGSGYWKTTGKDRAVCHGGRTIGMKKTLVFHIGRAPKGERSNWVMHEYRLEDEELVRAGIPQDAFVVCRIFQKRGPGPQNGAQYGAPFLEDEWEDNGFPIVKEEDEEEALIAVNNPGITVTEVDSDEQNKDRGVIYENAGLLVEPEGLDGFNNFVDFDSQFKICPEQELSDPVDRSTEVAELQSDQHLDAMGGNSDAGDPNGRATDLDDGYLELNDFTYPMGANCHENADCPEEILNNDFFVNDGITSPQELFDMKEYFNNDDESSELSEQFLPSKTGEDSCYVELKDLLCPEHGEPADDGSVYFDAPHHDLHANHGSSPGVDSFIDAAMANSNRPDPMDELIAYFDATDNMQLSDLNFECGSSSNQSDLYPVVYGENTEAYLTSPQLSEAVHGHGTSSSFTSGTNKLSHFRGVDIHDKPDAESGNSWGKALSKHLVSVLDSISPPPAFAAEYPLKGSLSAEHHPAAHSSSSIHITAGLIQMPDTAMLGYGKNWPMQKNVNAGLVLSYGTTRNDVTGNMVGFQRVPKMHGGITMFILQNSFHLFFLSVLFLAASFKIGVYIYTK